MTGFDQTYKKQHHKRTSHSLHNSSSFTGTGIENKSFVCISDRSNNYLFIWPNRHVHSVILTVSMKRFVYLLLTGNDTSKSTIKLTTNVSLFLPAETQLNHFRFIFIFPSVCKIIPILCTLHVPN